jgi:hypothetical protein
MMPIAHNQPPPVLIDLADVRVNVGRDLGLQRRRQHPPGTLPHELVQHRQ